MPRISGSSGSNRIKGTSSNDQVFGRAGNDVINAGFGNDKVFAGSGNDKVNGYAGNDRIFGEAGNDRLSGSDGKDTIDGGAGNDRINGGRQADRLFGADGNDQIYGSSGNDSVYGEAGNDTIDGGLGHDWLEGGTGDDLYGTYEFAGNDYIFDIGGTNDRLNMSEFEIGDVTISYADMYTLQNNQVVYQQDGKIDTLFIEFEGGFVGILGYFDNSGYYSPGYGVIESIQFFDADLSDGVDAIYNFNEIVSILSAS